MKKTLLTILLLFTASTLAACGSATAPQANSSGTDTGNGFGSAPLPLASEMMIGTFKLEGTDKAVSADEAAQLLPLWQVYKDLTSSSSAAQQEVDALADQIKETMTPEQVQAITDMKLTRGDLFKTMQDLGIAPAGRPNASGTPGPGGGNFPGGGNGFGGGNGVPGGGQGFGNGQNLTPEQIATFQARRQQNGASGGSSRIPSALYDALIKLLQGKK
jgi:hypothetical protein